MFVEVGPGRVLTGLVERILEGRPCLAVASDGKAGVDRLHHLLAQLFVHGTELSLDPLFTGRPTSRLELDRLVETTRPPAPAGTTWLVCGGRARPLQELPAAQKPAPRLAPKPVEAPRPPAAPRPEPSLPTPPAAPGGGGVIEQFQATMRQALEQQQRMVREAIDSQQKVMTTYLAAQQAVLTACLGGTPMEGVALPGLTAAPVTAPAAAPAPEVSPEPEPAPPAAPRLDLTALLLRLVSERTGYPTDVIGLDLDMEAELGIDSIKRIEILSGVQDHLPGGVSAGLEDGLEDLAQQKTIRQAVAWLENRLAQAATAPESVARGEETAAPESAVARHVVRAVDAAAIEQPRTVAKGGVVVLCGSGPLAAAVAAELRTRGLVAVPVDVPESEAEADKLLKSARRKGKLSGLVLVAPDAGEGELAGLDRADLVGRWFVLAKAAAPGLAEAGGKGFGILALSAMDGAFGLAGGPACPLAGGLGGLAKALARELPAVVVKSVDVPRRGDPAKAAARAVAEQLGGDPTVEVGLSGARRVTLRCVAEPACGEGVTLGEDDLVVVTGGARGITAEIAVALAERFGVRLALLGRTAVGGDESPATRGLTDLAAVKAALARELSAGGARPAPAEIEQAYRKLSAEREVCSTLERLRRAGAQAEACAVDVRDAAAVQAL
ncbi:MAG: hypothetical protein HYU66_24935, partial [Armatimonadetes bacterium]|nr:hypothetical protein [Armatimonadota bacterium]